MRQDGRTQRTTRAEDARQAAAFLILVAVAFAALARGAFAAAALGIVVALAAAALVCAFIAEPPTRADLDAPTIAATALALWYALSGAAAHHLSGAGPAVGLLVVLIAAVKVVQREDRRGRSRILTAVVGIGALVALTGWSGVALQQTPRAIQDNGLWRAASTITYANATGAFLAALALVALARLAEGELPRVHAIASFILLTGLAATASRGAVAGFVLGAIVLAVMLRRRVVRCIPAVCGAAVAIAALLPSMPSGHHTHPVLAAAGLVAGAVLALAPLRAAAVAVAVAALLALTVPGLRTDTRSAWDRVTQSRVSTSSSDRSHEWHAALHLAGHRPVAGIGPGNVRLLWTVVYFIPVDIEVRYAHNEYLQVADEAGLVALLIVVGGFLAIARMLSRDRDNSDTVTRAGVYASLIALAVQSALDFLWHVPVVPLAGAVLAGSLCARPDISAQLFSPLERLSPD